MDPIIQKLNQQVTEKLNKSTGVTEGEPSAFQQTYDKTVAERLLDKMKESYDVSSQGVSALSAENIHVNTFNPEVQGKNFNPSDQFSDMFKKMNKDLNSLDATLEVLTTPGIQLNARQLLAYQAGISNITITAEGFSRFADATTRGIQTLWNTQV